NDLLVNQHSAFENQHFGRSVLPSHITGQTAARPIEQCEMLLSTLLTATLAVSGQQPPPTTRPSATITRVATPPRLEDFLTGERRDGLVADAFLQREPGDLVPSTE